jgi:hypothetical protein
MAHAPPLPSQTFNFGEFPKLDERALAEMDEVLSRDIPALLHALSTVEYEASVDWHSLPHPEAARGAAPIAGAGGGAGGAGAGAGGGGYGGYGMESAPAAMGGPPAPPPKSVPPAPSRYHDPFVPAFASTAPTGEAVLTPALVPVVPVPVPVAPAPAPVAPRYVPAPAPVYAEPAPAPAPAPVARFASSGALVGGGGAAAAPRNPFAAPPRPAAESAQGTSGCVALCVGKGRVGWYGVLGCGAGLGGYVWS